MEEQQNVTCLDIRRDTHITSTLRGVGGLGKNGMLSDVRNGGVASVLGVQSLFFYEIGLDLRHDQTYYRQEFFLLTLLSGSEAIP